MTVGCPACGAEARQGDRFCSACGVALQSSQRVASSKPNDTRSFKAERKQVTILFADFSGFTSFAAHSDPEEVRDWMQSIWSKLDAIVLARGGTPEKHSGDALMAVFGERRAREEDPADAIRAALEMQAWLSEQNAHSSGTRLSLRIGVHTGLVVVGPTNSSGEFLATGDSVNLACRLEQNAPPGGVLVSAATYRHVFGFFDARAMPLLMVKGKSEPIETYLIQRAKPRGLAMQMRRVASVETEMIGRQAELRKLQDVFLCAMQNRTPRAITVVGEGGIGKSRLFFEFQKWIDLLPQFVRLFSARATSETTKLPFALIRDLFATRFEIQDSDSAPVARQKFIHGIIELSGGNLHPESQEELMLDVSCVGQLLGWDFSATPELSGALRDAEQMRHRALRGLGRLLSAMSRWQGPPAVPPVSAILMLLEDLQWADDGSLDVLDSLVRDAGEIPLMILASARPDFFDRRPDWVAAPSNISRIQLEPLNPAQSGSLVKSILARMSEVPPALLEMVTDAAEGNPYYIEEMINMLIDQRVIKPHPDVWHVELGRLAGAQVPATLTGVLQARLDGLASVERSVVRRAAVIGRVFWDDAILSMSKAAEGDTQFPMSGNELDLALQGLRRKELVFRRESSVFAGAVEYSFKHELLRNVAYESLLKKSRRLHHSQVAEWLIARSGERAGEFAGVIASHFELAMRLEESAEWHGRAGQQARRGYAPVIASSHFLKAVQLLPRRLDDRNHQSALLDWQEGLGETLGAQARFTEASEAYAAMCALAQQLAQPLAEARAWNGLAFLHERNGDNRASIECADRAADLAMRALPVGMPERIRSLHIKGWAWYRLGNAAAVLTIGNQTLKLCAAAGDRNGTAVSYKLLGVAQLQLGLYAEADSYFQQGLVLFVALGDRRNVAAMWSNRGEIARARGDYVTAADLYEKALTIAREIGHRESELVYLSNLGAVRVGLGKFAEAERDLQEVMGKTTGPNSCMLAEVLSFLSEACLGQGKLAEAVAAAHRAVVLAKESENLLFLGGAWRALGLCGTHALSGDDHLKDAKGEKLMPNPSPSECFSESLRVFQQIKAEGERARTLRAWGNYELTNGSVASGLQKLQEALDMFSRLDARFEVLEIENLLRRFARSAASESEKTTP